jgi:hypothetical protein
MGMIDTQEKTPEQMWERFMDHLAKVDPIGTRENPHVRHGAFLGSIEKYRKIFLEANKR